MSLETYAEKAIVYTLLGQILLSPTTAYSCVEFQCLNFRNLFALMLNLRANTIRRCKEIYKNISLFGLMNRIFIQKCTLMLKII